MRTTDSTKCRLSGKIRGGNTMLLLSLTIWSLLSLDLGSGSEVTDLGCLGSTCYWLVGKAIRFSEAGSACAMVNETSLVPASILDDVTNTYLTSQITLVGKVSYIGAIAKSFPWKWTSGEALEVNIRNNSTGSCVATCGAMEVDLQGEGRLEAHRCTAHHRYICKPKGEHTTAPNLYISDAKYTWNYAREACLQRRMDLLTFADSSLEGVSSLIRSNQQITGSTTFWVGVYSRTWTWIADGAELLYSRNNAPNCYTYIILNIDGTWVGIGSCCASVLCQSKDPQSTWKAMDRIPSEKKASTPKGINIVQQVIIPIVCVVGGALITVLVILVWWKTRKQEKAKAMSQENHGYERTTSSQDHQYDVIQ